MVQGAGFEEGFWVLGSGFRVLVRVQVRGSGCMRATSTMHLALWTMHYRSY